MQIPVALERLVYEFSRFPGVGRKTAQRLAFNILRYSQQETQNLADALIEVKAQIRYCSGCSGFTDIDPCAICSHSGREHAQVCVVEQPNNIFPIEKSGVFKGVYHVLMGAISPMDGIGPNDLNISPLLEKVKSKKVKEIIFALSPTMEGDTTNFYLYKKLKEFAPLITTLSRGVSVGAELHYADEMSLSRSITQRQKYDQE